MDTPWLHSFEWHAPRWVLMTRAQWQVGVCPVIERCREYTSFAHLPLCSVSSENSSRCPWTFGGIGVDAMPYLSSLCVLEVEGGLDASLSCFFPTPWKPKDKGHNLYHFVLQPLQTFYAEFTTSKFKFPSSQVKSLFKVFLFWRRKSE